MTSRASSAHPLAGLKPVVVDHYAEHGIKVLLGADAITTAQRDAALSYLDEKLGSSSGAFSLVGGKIGERLVIGGPVRTYVGDLTDEIVEVVQPKYARTGALSLKTVRNKDRQKVGVEATLKLGDRYGLSARLPELAETPSQALRLIHRGTTVVFSLKKPGREDTQLIRAALKVADAYGVFIMEVPNRVEDTDSDARLIPAFDYRD